MSIRRIAVLVSLVALLCNACASMGLGSRSPALDRIQKSGQLRIGMTGDYPPLNMIDRTDQNIGLEPDLARALAITLGVELVIVNKPFAELIPALENGEVDAVMSGMTMTPQRNMSVAFAGPYFVSGKAVLTRSETLARATQPGILDESSVKLVTLEGTTSQGFVENAMPKSTLVTAPTYEKAVAMVIGGEVDALVADYPICVVSVLRNPGAGLQSVISPFTFEPIGIALPADDMLFVNLVQNYLKSLEGTGLLDQVRLKWFADPSWLLELP
jgi:polar amino acid transport system substrate-binding protein